MRNGGDAAKTEVVAYFADLFEKLWQRFLGYDAKTLTAGFRRPEGLPFRYLLRAKGLSLLQRAATTGADSAAKLGPALMYPPRTGFPLSAPQPSMTQRTPLARFRVGRLSNTGHRRKRIPEAGRWHRVLPIFEWKLS